MFKKAVMLVSVMILSVGITFATSIPETTITDNTVYSAVYNNVTGSVVDANSGDPVPNATVTINEETATTDEYGTFTFEELDAGTHTVTVEADGYESAEQSIDVTEEGSNIEITLQPSM